MDQSPVSGIRQESPDKFLNALAENYLLQDAILNATELAVISTHLDGTITSINKVGEPMLGYTALELIGFKKLSVFHEPEQLDELRAELAAEGIHSLTHDEVLTARAGKKIQDHREWNFRRKDGTVFPAKLSMTGIWNEEGTLVGFLAIVEDITQDKKNEVARRKNEEALRLSKIHLEAVTHELRHQNHQLNEFAHIISHNLRSPVGNIGALISLLSERSTLDDYKTIFENLKTASGNLQETLNDLMETMMVKEQSPSERVPVFFDEVFQKIKQGFTGDIIRHNAIVTHNFSACPEIYYSRQYLESIFLNLLSNAIKYRSPQRTLRVHFETFDEEGKEVLRVTDNGLGIDLEQHGHLLFNLRKTFHVHKEARGVGLFLTKTQVETMGGTIGAESAPGKGSTFTIRFAGLRS